jgi:hypothetical protein
MVAATTMAMASWDEIKSQLSRYQVVSQRDREVLLSWKGIAILVRAVRIFDVDWLRVGAPIAHARHAPLEGILRRAEQRVGAVVIEGERCILRETLCLPAITPETVHGVIAVIGSEASALRKRERDLRSVTACAEQFAT